MSRRYRKAVEQYLAVHAPRTLQRGSGPRDVAPGDTKQLIASYADKVAAQVLSDYEFIADNDLARPSRELRARIERVVFPLVLTRVAPPEREEMKGIGDAEQNFIALSETVLETPTPMGLRAREAYDQFCWETDQPVYLVDGGIASTWEEIVEAHAQERTAVNVLRGLNGEGLQLADNLIVSAMRGEGRQLGGGIAWEEAASVVTRELRAGTFEMPASEPELSRADLEAAGEYELLTQRNEAADRWRLRSHLYDVVNPGAEISSRMPETLRATTPATLDMGFVQHTVEVFHRDTDPTTKAAVKALRELRPERVEQLRVVFEYDHTPPGAEHEPITPADLMHAVKKEVDRGTFTAPAQRPDAPVLGDHLPNIDLEERDEYLDGATADYARDLIRIDVYEQSKARPNDIHAAATATPTAGASVVGASL